MSDTSFTGKITLNTEYTSVSIRRHKLINWRPADDITVLELAKITPLLIAMAKEPLAYWEDYIPSEALRHFHIADQA